MNHPQNPQVNGVDFNHTRFSMVGLVGIRAYQIEWGYHGTTNKLISNQTAKCWLVVQFHYLEKY